LLWLLAPVANDLVIPNGRGQAYRFSRKARLSRSKRSSNNGREEMDEKDQQIAHFRIVARNQKLAEFPQISNSPWTGGGRPSEVSLLQHPLVQKLGLVKLAKSVIIHND
jgi:hypothetical protein